MDFIGGDIVTLKKDCVARIVRFQENDIVYMDWIDVEDDYEWKNIKAHKDDVNFLARTVNTK